MKHTRLLLIAVAVVFGACGSPAGSTAPTGQPASPSTAPSPSPTTNPSPTPVPSLSPAELGKLYLAAATTYNKAVKAAINKYLSSNKGLTATKREYAAIAKAELAFIRAVQAIPFTPTFTSAAARLITCTNELYVLELAGSRATSFTQLNYYADRAAKKSDTCSGYANELRIRLGLDPVPPI